MNKKRSNDDDDLQGLPQNKRLATPALTRHFDLEPMPSLLSSNVMPTAGSESTIVPSNPQDYFAVFLAESSFTPSFTIQTDATAISSADESLLPQPIAHQDMIPNHEVLRDQLEYLIPSASDVDWDAIAAMEEYLQRARTENPEWDYFQHTPCAEQVQYDQFGLTAYSNPFIEGSSQPGMSLGANQMFNDQGASMDQFGGFTSALSMAGTTIHGLYDPGHTLADQSLFITSPSELQLPAHNHMFESAHWQKVDIGGNARLTNIAGKTNVINHWHDGTHGLEKMEKFVSFRAQFDSSAQDPNRVCHPGTRQNVLRRVEGWIDDPNSTERIFWLHGPAGAGKSAIAQTIAKSCGRQKVAATFFFFRSDSSRNDGNMLFPTLAYQLAFSIPAMKDHIAQSLHTRPDLPTKGVEIQFDELIALPFRSLFGVTSQQTSTGNTFVAFNECQQTSPVIIIDGVDECTDEKLQERFVKIIGDAVKDRSIPFRFLICSRPEAVIEDAFTQFKPLICSIDLAKLDDANRDIEKFLMEEFSRIASKRHLRPSWPGRAVIEDIIYKSSGNFIFASVVIKVVGDEDSVPEDQLDIILNLKPPDRMSPFAVLDELYLEILSRQLYQDFLKTFLALFVGRIAIMEYFQNSKVVKDRWDVGLYKDDAKLMNVSEEALYTKLRKMRSLLKFEPHIDVHHRSFLDFLNDLSRAGDYYVNRKLGTKLYLNLIIESIVRHVSRVIEDPDYHEAHHLNFNLNLIIAFYPLSINLTIEELQDVSRPLLQVQDQILNQLDSRITTDLLFCPKCAVSGFIRPLLLHLAIYQSIDVVSKVEESVTEGKGIDTITSIHPEAMESLLESDLDNILSSLLARLHETKSGLSHSRASTAIIKYTCSLLRFDCAEIALKVRSMLDAQILVDILIDLIDERHILIQYEPDGMSKAARLVLNIFVRIPILPRSLLFRVDLARVTPIEPYPCHIDFACDPALMWKILDHRYTRPELHLQGYFLSVLDCISECPKGWAGASVLSQEPEPCVMEVMLEVARAIQYLHSMGVTLNDIHKRAIYCDLSVRPRIVISFDYLSLINPFVIYEYREDCIFGFGRFFYEIYFNKAVSSGRVTDKRKEIAQRPSSPTIPEYAWQLIQHCCVEDPEDRPTIDEIVEEMETWKI